VASMEKITLFHNISIKGGDSIETGPERCGGTHASVQTINCQMLQKVHT